jgi:hypothetical protein
MKKATSTTEKFNFTSVLERSDNKLWGSHFPVPNRVVTPLIEDNSRRVVCTLNGTVEYQCAMLPHGNGSFVITVNTKRCDQLGLKFGMEIDVALRKDASEYGLPMPEELQELFRQDKQGSKVFHALTRGKQRTLLYIVGNAKSSEKRVVRAIAVVNHLKVNKGKINYKQLNIALKSRGRLPFK